jgi:RND family efflux transporter MFP subunit
MSSTIAKVVGIALVLSVPGTLWLWRNPSAAQAAPTTRAPEGSVTVRAQGRVAAKPNAEAVVTIATPGRIARLLVTEGQTVQRGQTLAELESELETAALAEARARVQEIEAELRWLRVDRGRSETLAQAGAISRVALEGDLRRAELANKQLAAASAAAQRTAVALEQCRLLAPISGRVVSRNVRVGEVPEAGRALFTIVDLDELRVEAEVDEFDIARVRLGASVKMHVEGYEPRVWLGKISEIPATLAARRLRPSEPARDSDGRVLQVKIEPDAPLGLLMGQRLELDIEDGKQPGATP